MATLTGNNLLDSIIDSTGIEVNALIYATLSAKLQQMIDNGTYSKLAAGIAVSAFSTEINAATEIADLGDVIETNQGLIEAAADEAAVDALDFPDYGGLAPITYTLTASAAQINEGDANTFTVEASRAVEADTDVTFQLYIDKDGDSAQAADFNAGSFNPVTVTIAAGETSAVFDLATITADGTETSENYTVGATVGGEELFTQVTILDGSAGAGQTFALTEKADVIPGLVGSNGNTVTSGNDTIIGIIEKAAAPATTTTTTLNTSDVIDAGEGTDTLKIFSSGAALTAADVPVATNVEVVELSAAADATVDTSAWSGLNEFNVTKLGGATTVTAGAATDINVETNAAATASTLAVNGGDDVAVDLANVKAGNGATNAITVGATAAKGAVSVEQTGAAITAGTDIALGNVTATGGTSITVTQNATSDASASAADITGATVTQGAVGVNGNASTTEVTVKQDATVAEVKAVEAVAAKATTQEVSFTAAKAGDNVTLDFNGAAAGSLKFTAEKDLTATEVASAFANLAKDSLQGNAAASLGTYFDDTGVGVTGGWYSGDVQTVSATEAKVVFSNASVTPTAITSTAVQVGTGSTFTSTAAGAVAGVAAKSAVTGVLGVADGIVTIKDSGTGTIKTITVDGYADTSRIGGVAGTDDTLVLETLNLSNSGFTYDAAGKITGAAGMTVDDTAATLALNIENLGGSVYYNGDPATTVQEAALDFTAAPTTLNVNSIGNNYVNLTDTAGNIQTLNVSGTGVFDADNNDLTGLTTVKVTESAGVKLNAGVDNTVTSVDTTGTTGTTTISIQGDKATYSGGAGKDMVSVTNASTAISKTIDLGAGDDSLDLSATAAVVPTVNIEGGEGSDTIKLDAANAVSLSGNGNFEAKINSFDKLSLTKATATGTVDLANMDDISYVISANSDAGAATKEVISIDFASSGTITGADTIAFDGATTTLAGSETATQIALAFAGKTYTNWDVTGVTGSAVTLTAKVAGVTNDVVNGDVVITDTDATTAAAGATQKTAEGDGVTKEAFTIDFATSGAIEDADTIAFDGATTTLATGDNAGAIAGKVAATSYANWDTSVLGTVVTFTNKSVGAVNDPLLTDFTFTNVKTATTAPVVAASVTSQGAAAGAGGALTLDKMASGGTLELTGAGAGVVVKVTDATDGTADVLNVVTNAATGSNLGTVEADKVETINVDVKDTDATTTTTGKDNVSTNTLKLDADAAKTVSIDGAGNLNLTFTTDSKAITLIDGSDATGKLDIVSVASDTAATTVKGGSADDALTAAGTGDILEGGAGKDTLTVAAGAQTVTMTGGDGMDKFVVESFNAGIGSAVTITDLEKGETIEFDNAATAKFVSAQVTQISSATFTEWVTAAADTASDSGVGSIAWFQFTAGSETNTFLVQNNVNDNTFDEGTDTIVQLSGVVDLSASSFNADTQGTLMYL